MGTETFQVIRYENVPADRRNNVTYTKVVCKVRAQKDNPNRTRIAIGGKKFIYLGDVATPTYQDHYKQCPILLWC